MSLKDNWVDKVNDVDDVMAEDINDIARAVIALENKKNTAPVTSVNGKTGDVTIGKSDVGLGNVDNTSDVDKPISNAMRNALNGKISYETVYGNIDDCFEVGNSRFYYVLYQFGTGVEKGNYYILSVTESHPEFTSSFPPIEHTYTLTSVQYKFTDAKIKTRTGKLYYKEYEGTYNLLDKEWTNWQESSNTTESNYIELNFDSLNDLNEINHNNQSYNLNIGDSIFYKGKIADYLPYLLLVQVSEEEEKTIHQILWYGDSYSSYYQRRSYIDNKWSAWAEFLTTNNTIDNLLSNSVSLPLSANQGRMLNEKIGDIDKALEDIIKIQNQLMGVSE